MCMYICEFIKQLNSILYILVAELFYHNSIEQKGKSNLEQLMHQYFSKSFKWQLGILVHIFLFKTKENWVTTA